MNERSETCLLFAGNSYDYRLLQGAMLFEISILKTILSSQWLIMPFLVFSALLYPTEAYLEASEECPWSGESSLKVDVSTFLFRKLWSTRDTPVLLQFF